MGDACAEDPAVLSEDSEQLEPSSISLLWKNIPNQSLLVARLEGTLNSVRECSSLQEDTLLAIQSVLHETRVQISLARTELDSIKRCLQVLESRLVTCESHLGLNSLD